MRLVDLDNAASRSFGFAAVFGRKDVLGGTNDGLGERLANPVIGLKMAGRALFGGVKDLADAAIHGAAGLFEMK